MNSALIVSASAKGAARIEEWLEGTACTFAAGEAQAHALLAAKRYDVVVVNAPLADGSGESLCKAAEDLILLVPQAAYADVAARMAARGVMTLSKPLNPQVFRQALCLMEAARAKVGRLQAKLSEVRIVERAKWALIQTLQMDEAQAHRYIEKQAMNQRMTRREVAENILKTYEN